MDKFQLSVEKLAEVVSGKVLCKKEDSFLGIGSDTRQALNGRLFIPFKGENFDGHDYLQAAVEKGAGTLLVHKEDGLPRDVSIVKVDDTLKAFQTLATYHRRQMKAKVLAFTGSNGKTTSKDFAAAILSANGEVAYNQKSFNNHWGVPISLLSIEPQHEWALIEMGMNHQGEIGHLCEIAEPDIVAVTMVGASHLEGLGSIEGVAAGKKEIYTSSPNEAIRIFNLDNEHTKKMHEELANSSSVTFSTSDEGADLCIGLKSCGVDFIEVEGRIGKTKGMAKIPVFGAHNLTNILVASSLSWAAGVEEEKIWRSLPLCKNSWGRGQFVDMAGTKVLFDAYNANPESMAALLRNIHLVEDAGRKVAILGEMKELGEKSDFYHEALGEEVAKSGFESIWFVGESNGPFEAGLERAKYGADYFFSSEFDEKRALELKDQLADGDLVVIKGSRGIGLEKVLDAWQIEI